MTTETTTNVDTFTLKCWWLLTELEKQDSSPRSIALLVAGAIEAALLYPEWARGLLESVNPGAVFNDPEGARAFIEVFPIEVQS